jgi:gluconolactonase
MFSTEMEENLSYSYRRNWTSNVTFGGKNNDVLFITASKSVYTLPTRVRGVK